MTDSALRTPTDDEIADLVTKGLLYQVEDAFERACYANDDRTIKNHLVADQSLRSCSIQYAQLVLAAMIAPHENPSEASKIVTASTTPYGCGIQVRLGRRAPIKTNSQERRTKSLRDQGLIATKGKASTYTVTFLPTHPYLADAVMMALAPSWRPALGDYGVDITREFVSSSEALADVACARYSSTLGAPVSPVMADHR